MLGAWPSSAALAAPSRMYLTSLTTWKKMKEIEVRLGHINKCCTGSHLCRHVVALTLDLAHVEQGGMGELVLEPPVCREADEEHKRVSNKHNT